MCLRYSSSVVAPMQCSSPRASIGLSRLPASMAPSALPAPTTVCSSSMNRMISPADSCTSFSTALRRSSNSPRILGAGDQRAHVERDDALVLQPFRHVAAHDALRQAFHDGGLADAGLADQHRIVLGAAGEHLDDAADLLVAADHRVELALRGEFGEVAAVPLERLVSRLGILRRDALVAAHLAQRLHQPLAGEAEFLEQPAGGAVVVGRGKQDVLDRDVLVLELAGLVLGAGEQSIEP